jgi:uncharacterized protein YoaH (UPF0181 family)
MKTKATKRAKPRATKRPYRYSMAGRKSVAAKRKANKRKRNIAPAILAAAAASGVGSYLGTKHGMTAAKAKNSRKSKRSKKSKTVVRRKKNMLFERARTGRSSRPPVRTAKEGGRRLWGDIKAAVKGKRSKRAAAPRAKATSSSGLAGDVASALVNMGYKRDWAKKRASQVTSSHRDFDSAFRAAMQKNPRPKLPRAQQRRASQRIAKLMREGVKPKQAIAEGLNEARAGRLGTKGGYKRAVNVNRRGLKRNPMTDSEIDRAAALYSKFHGKSATEVKEYLTSMRTKFAGLGKLVSLIMADRDVQIQWANKEQPMLAADPDGKQLYIIGGNQDLQLPAGKDFLDLGEVEQIEYFTQKDFDQFQPIVYFHKFGEETGERPRLMYDTYSQRLHLIGGAYKIKKDGIIN